MDKGKPAPRQKIINGVWADAQTGIDQKIVDERKAKGQFTRCTLTHHRWKHCQEEIRVSTIQRKSFKLIGRRSHHPKPRKSSVASVADDSRGQSSQQASQRPEVWTFMEDKEL